MKYCNRQVHRDFFITLYKPFHRVCSPTVVSPEHIKVSNNVTPPHVWALVLNASWKEPTSVAKDIN
jgi:hypothetical protein